MGTFEDNVGLSQCSGGMQVSRKARFCRLTKWKIKWPDENRKFSENAESSRVLVKWKERRNQSGHDPENSENPGGGIYKLCLPTPSPSNLTLFLTANTGAGPPPWLQNQATQSRSSQRTYSHNFQGMFKNWLYKLRKSKKEFLRWQDICSRRNWLLKVTVY